MIKAPYNFVPVARDVFFPQWASEISLDQPFEDGVCGSIEYEIEAQTPIFVKDSQDDADGVEQFCKINGEYAIPGSSIKGAIRNVLEMMTFSQMSLDENARYAQREWDNPSLYTLKGNQSSLRCGYIKRREDGSLYIVDCGLPYRIGHKQVDQYLDASNNVNGRGLFERYFAQTSPYNVNRPVTFNGKEYDIREVEFKNALCGDIPLGGLTFSEDTSDVRLKYDPMGNIEGRIVLTGQPSKWLYPRPTQLTRNAGKFYEFVFENPGERSKKYDLSEEEFNQYKFIYTDSSQWSSFEAEMNQSHSGVDSGMPIFFRLQNNRVKDFGLAYLYKLPYENTPYDLLPDSHRDKTQIDMASCMFGYISNDPKIDKQSALKGRVQFAHAKASRGAVEGSCVNYIMANPKASYYPNYIAQKGGQYKTYNDGELSGWKRYVNRAEVIPGDSDAVANTSTQHTKFKPLNSGVKFTGKIYFHNLKEVELGALLSALTLHNSQNGFHQIGKAKAFGYGRIKLGIKDLNLTMNNQSRERKSEKDLMALFEILVNQYLRSVGVNCGWINTNTISELSTLTSTVVHNNNLFGYMSMEVGGTNEFVDAKRRSEYLKLLSQQQGSVTRFNSLIDLEKVTREIADLATDLEPKAKQIGDLKDEIVKQFESLKEVKDITVATAECDSLRDKLSALFELYKGMPSIFDEILAKCAVSPILGQQLQNWQTMHAAITGYIDAVNDVNEDSLNTIIAKIKEANDAEAAKNAEDQTKAETFDLSKASDYKRFTQAIEKCLKARMRLNKSGKIETQDEINRVLDWLEKDCPQVEKQKIQWIKKVDIFCKNWTAGGLTYEEFKTKRG